MEFINKKDKSKKGSKINRENNNNKKDKNKEGNRINRENNGENKDN